MADVKVTIQVLPGMCLIKLVMRKKLLVSGIMFVCTFLSVGFAFEPPNNPPKNKVCRGYSIVSAGIGLDCKGDTVLLIKRNGFYERIK